MKIIILDSCKKEMNKFPQGILSDLVNALALLEKGISLSMPLSKNLFNIEKGLSEIRLKDKDGIYRVFYLIKKRDGIYILHAFQKKKQEIPAKTVKLLKSRIGRLK